MASQKLTLIDIRKVTTIEDVLSNLQKLNSRLDDLDLGQFILFNESYQVVTRSIVQAIEDNYFKNPKFIEKIIVSFSSYYFQAVNDTVSKDPKLSLPWSKLNEYAKDKSSPVFMSLMLGANAHINNDLPQVLKELMQKEKTEDFLGDVAKIDKLLMKSGKEIVGLFEETNKVLNFLKRRFQFMYYRPAMYTILYWRIGAWRNYRRLKKDSSSKVGITNRSVKIADRLLYISNILA